MMSTRNPQSEDIIDLTDVGVTSTSILLSNSVICIDSDDSFCISPCRKTEHHNNVREVSCESPTDKRSKQKGKHNIGECPICWDELGRKPLSSTICGHVFCTTCIKHSIRIEKKCPICRTILKGKLPYHPLYLGK